MAWTPSPFKILIKYLNGDLSEYALYNGFDLSFPKANFYALLLHINSFLPYLLIYMMWPNPEVLFHKGCVQT